ncbi:MAG TPA: FAD binding domain-containing protein [Treponemataceae bacterium]|jgi:CO/xanthine dehydrogenase FAD-binding subunit|nr:MAG: putative xanthine dehydrogenase subunit C [Spirochaetes bacterium ADurb.Bin269]TAH54520.1 MAG: FAD-binding protein [Treponema sp.]HOC29556.1 FAD binding domain-containing protein [Treponemataceae bacterium]
MANRNSTVYQASTIADVQSILKNISGVSIVAGGTEIVRRQTGRTLHFSPNILPVSRIAELTGVAKTERYIEFGSCITLKSLLELGSKNVPDILYRAVQGIASPGIRSLATLGGNIAAKGQRLCAFAPLLALDARLEIRTPTEAYWIPMARYFSNTGKEQSKEPEFISKIRVPTDAWEISEYRRIGKPGIVTDTTATFAFLVQSQKNVLADIRIAYAGKFFFRRREFENLMIGRSLPLSEKDIDYLMDKADAYFDKNLFPPSYERKCLFNMLEESLSMLV